MKRIEGLYRGWIGLPLKPTALVLVGIVAGAWLEYSFGAGQTESTGGPGRRA